MARGRNHGFPANGPQGAAGRALAMPESLARNVGPGAGLPSEIARRDPPRVPDRKVKNNRQPASPRPRADERVY